MIIQFIKYRPDLGSKHPPPLLGDKSKWDIVRSGVAQFLRALPEDTAVGVRVFGHTAAPCSGSEQLRKPEPLGPHGAQDIIRELDRLNPAGDTPLVDTINAAADDLGPSAGEIIVLSDGLDTCGGVNHLCATARAIAARGELVRIDMVETFMDEDAKRAIACVPEATGGVAVNFVGGDPAALGVVLRHLMPVRLMAAILLIVFGSVSFFSLCDLFAGALGAVVWHGTAGFVADLVFGITASLWAVFWLTRLAHFPFAVATILAVAIILVLCRHIPRQRSQAGDGWS